MGRVRETKTFGNIILATQEFQRSYFFYSNLTHQRLSPQTLLGFKFCSKYRSEYGANILINDGPNSDGSSLRWMDPFAQIDYES